MFPNHYSSTATYTTDIDKTRNSSGDEIANVNFLCDDIVHTLKIQ